MSEYIAAKQNPFNISPLKRNGTAISPYKLIDDSYNGSGGYLSKDFLVKHKRETPEDFNIRRELSPYKGFSKKIINNFHGAVFTEEPKREITNPDAVYDAFMKNADGTGNDYKTMINWSGLDCVKYGFTLLVMDNHSDLSVQEQANIKAGKIPYTYSVRPDRITALYVDTRNKAVGVTYSFDSPQEDGTFETLYRTWTETETFVTSSTIDNFNDVQEADKLNLFVHDLNSLPVLFAYSYSSGGEYFVAPMFLSAVEVNDSVFQRNSEIREFERKFAFPILTVQGGIETEADEEGNQKALVGSDKALIYDSEVSNSPDFLSANVDAMKASAEAMAQDEAYLNALAGSDSTLSSSSSAETRRVFWSITNMDKSDFATQMERTERLLIQILGLWVHGNRDYYDFSVRYSRQFGLEDEEFKLELLSTRLALVEDFPIVKEMVFNAHIDTILPNATPDQKEIALGEVKTKIAEMTSAQIITEE